MAGGITVAAIPSPFPSSLPLELLRCQAGCKKGQDFRAMQSGIILLKYFYIDTILHFTEWFELEEALKLISLHPTVMGRDTFH